MMVPRQKVARFSHRETYSHAKTFGSIAAMPLTLGRVPRYIKNQGTTNYCTAAARSVAGSYLWDEEMGFEWTTAKEGEQAGHPIFSGADPAQADIACEEYGFLPQKDCPLSFQKDGWQLPAQYQQYDTSLNDISVAYTGFTPFNVYPDFDSIQQALFQGKDDNAIVLANGYWFSNWQNPINGYVPMPDTPVTRHCYAFIDWTEEYLVAQLSQGEDFGNGGLIYMTKEQVNAAFANPALNGIGCTIYRKTASNPVRTKVQLLQQLVMLCGRILSLIGLKL